MKSDTSMYLTINDLALQVDMNAPQQSTSAVPPMSATKRKFSYRRGLHPRTMAQRANIETSFVRCKMMNRLVKGLLCLNPQCGAPTLKIRAIDCRLGLICRYETYCTTCATVLNKAWSSDRLDDSTKGNIPFSVNRQAVAATMDMGVGHTGLLKLCRFMDMQEMHHKTYAKHVRAITKANKAVVKTVLDEAAVTVRKACQDLDPTITEDAILDLTVSFDGSWMTRGHKSLYGVGCVVEVTTGLVLDFCVLSLYCQRCTFAKKLYGGAHTPAFQQWFETHTECNKNYNGTSGGMEVAAAEILWKRSLERGYMYTTMVSDGDARTFNHLTNLEVYGNVILRKEECINHVSKRLGTALRKLASSGKKTGVTIGGRGFGRLTARAIDKLTHYYGDAVRSHPNDLDGMQAAVMASFDHAISTDDEPNHDNCPVGVNSWCFYQKALATGQQPGPHRTNVHTPLSAEVGVHVKEVYARLAHKDLLRRCLKQKTQNANESLHSMIWSKCHKSGFVGLQRVLSATCTAVSQFNCGVELTMQHLCGVMGIPSGVHMSASSEKADAKRLRGADLHAMKSTKMARLARKRARLAEAERSKRDYAAGEF